MKFLFPNFLNNFWISNPRRTCSLTFLLQGILLILIFILGFIYIHCYIPYYNAKRLSKHNFVCSTVADNIVPDCEIQVEVNPSNFYEESHSIGIPGPNGTILGERHFKWSSCGEFCSVEGVENGKGCRQIEVNVRAPGSNLRLERCTNHEIFECGHKFYNGNEFDPGSKEIKDEIEPEIGRSGLSVSTNLEGVYECKLQSTTKSQTDKLICIRASNKWTCPAIKSTPGEPGESNTLLKLNCTHNLALNSSISFCFDKPGLYICTTNGTCQFNVNPRGSPYCAKKCESIQLQNKNIIVTNHQGRVITSNCWKGFHSQENFEIWPRGFRNKINPSQPPALFLTCNIIKTTHSHSAHSSSSIAHQDVIRMDLGDCVNGTLLENSTLPVSMSFSALEKLWFETMLTEDFLLDPIEQNHAPPEANLALFTKVPLYFEDFYESKNACIATSDESESCTQFYLNYGLGINDLGEGSGADLAQGHLPLFPCYCRNTIRSTYCIANGSKLFTQTWKEHFVSKFIIPYAIPLISIFSVIFCAILIFLGCLMWPVFQDFVIGVKKVENSIHNNTKDLKNSNSRRSKLSRSGDSLSVYQLDPRGSLNSLKSYRRQSMLVISSGTPLSIMEIDPNLVTGVSPSSDKAERLFELRDFKRY